MSIGSPQHCTTPPCRELQSINRQWNDEKLYQESRRILNAEYQHILYNEFLPKLIGRKGTTGVRGFPINVLTRGFSRDYSDKFDSRLMNEFSTAAYRVGHSLIPGLINMFSTVKENLEVNFVLYSLSKGAKRNKLGNVCVFTCGSRSTSCNFCQSSNPEFL